MSATLDPGTWVFISAVGCLLIVAALVLLLALADSLDRKNEAYPRRRRVYHGQRDNDGGSIGRQVGVHVEDDQQLGPDDDSRENGAELHDVNRPGSDIYPELPDNYVLLKAPLQMSLGRDPAALVGSTFLKVTHPNDVTDALRCDALPPAGGPVSRGERRFCRGDGRVIWVALTVSRLPAARGLPTHLVVHADDVTERRQHEADLQHRSLRSLACASADRSLRQLVGDLVGPGVDLGPGAEVALGQQGAAGGQRLDQPVTEPEFARVQRAEEDPVVTGMDGLPELGDLLGLRARPHVPAIRVGGLGAEWSAAEQPHRLTCRQACAVASDELRALLQPLPEVDRAADHEGLIAGQIGDRLHRPRLRLMSCLRQLLGDALCDCLRAAVPARMGNKNLHSCTSPALGDPLGHISINTSTPTIDKGVRQEAKDFSERAFASGSASIPSCTVESGEE